MKKNNRLTATLVIMLAILSACHKSNNDGGGSSDRLPGTLDWFFAGDAGYYEPGKDNFQKNGHSLLAV